MNYPVFDNSNNGVEPVFFSCRQFEEEKRALANSIGLCITEKFGGSGVKVEGHMDDILMYLDPI